jgi:hypothetical protein
MTKLLNLNPLSPVNVLPLPIFAYNSKYPRRYFHCSAVSKASGVKASVLHLYNLDLRQPEFSLLSESIPHRVMHLCVAPPYSLASKRIKLASQWVADEVARGLLSQERAGVLDFLRHAVGERHFASVRGQLFESFCHNVFSNRGDFEARSLQTQGSRMTMHLSRCSRASSDRVEDVDLTKAGLYYQPKSKSFPSVDSLASPNMLFQITVSENHSVKMAALENVLAHILPDDVKAFSSCHQTSSTYSKSRCTLLKMAKLPRQSRDESRLLSSGSSRFCWTLREAL